jgi:hypothetical protein
MPKKHDLKTWPEHFKYIKTGIKTFEIRENDRGFEVGDILNLREFSPCSYCNGSGRVRDYTDLVSCNCMESKNPKGKYSGRSIKRKVVYILHGPSFGLGEKYCCMSIKPVKENYEK